MLVLGGILVLALSTLRVPILLEGLENWYLGVVHSK